MGEAGECQDCERCTASLASRLGRGLAAVGTLGITEVAIGVGDAFKRTCPTCKHPLGLHEGARIRLMNPPPANVSPPAHPPQPHPVYVPIPIAVPVPMPQPTHVSFGSAYGAALDPAYNVPPAQSPPSLPVWRTVLLGPAPRRQACFCRADCLDAVRSRLCARHYSRGRPEWHDGPCRKR